MNAIRIGFIMASVLACLIARAEELVTGPFKGIDISGFSAERQRAIALANEDCILIEGYKLPKNSRPAPLEFLDGGSRAFYGPGYVVVLRASLFGGSAKDRVFAGYIYGYGLYLVSAETFAERRQQRPDVAKLYFVSAKRMSEIQKANASELESRIPKDWLQEDK